MLALFPAFPACGLAPIFIDDVDLAQATAIVLSYALLLYALASLAVVMVAARRLARLRANLCPRCAFQFDQQAPEANAICRCTDCGLRTATVPIRQLNLRIIVTGLAAMVVAAYMPVAWTVTDFLPPDVRLPDVRTHLTINLAVAAVIAVLIVALNNPRELLADLRRPRPSP